LDKTFDLIYEHCTLQEKEKLELARLYFYTKEESCRGDRDNDRQFAFNELETGITQANQVVEILKANPKTGPFEAARQISPFYLWSPQDRPGPE